MSRKVAVIAGGKGAEAEVSRTTSESFCKALEELGHKYVLVEADENLVEQIKAAKPDAALLALHGKWGEDGTVQGILEYLRIPYTGSGVLASSLSMDKAYCKKLFASFGIPSAKYQILNTKEIAPEKFVLELSYPIVVKPSRDGSSVGVSIVKEEKELLPALREAAQYDHYVVIEKFIDGKEIAVSVIKGKPLVPIEIVPKSGFYDYDNKYTAGNTDYILPANLEERTKQQIEAFTIQTCELMRVRSYARVDFLVDKSGNPYLLEVNTLPGCTPTSLVPKAAQHDGISFKDFIDYILETATTDYEDLK